MNRLRFLLFVLLAMAGCADLHPAREPDDPVAVPESFSDSGDRPLPDRWWLDFQDRELTDLVARALEGNLGLRTYWDRLAQFKAIARRTGAARAVQVDGRVGAGGDVSGRDQDVTRGADLVFGLAASYELDVWGRLQAREQAAVLDAAASEEELRAAAISLSALVAGTWYQLVEQRAQIDLLSRQMKTNEQVLELITLRFRQGKLSSEDVLRQRQLVEATRANRLIAEGTEGVLENQLAVLLGVAPRSITFAEVRDLTELPPLPATGIPADLVERRPDIRRSFQRVLAADRRVAEAMADRYPRIVLSASASTTTTSFGDVFNAWLVSIAADAVAPLLDGGEREAEVDRTRALVSERIHDYGDTVLGSLQEVEDALVRERKQREYIESLQTQYEIATTVVERMRDRHTKGGIEYLDVLQALTSQQGLERSILTAHRQLLGYRISLCRALAGGWTMVRPEPATIAGADKPESTEQHGE